MDAFIHNMKFMLRDSRHPERVRQCARTLLKDQEELIKKYLSNAEFNRIRLQAIQTISYKDTMEMRPDELADVERRLIYDRLAQVYLLSQTHLIPQAEIHQKKEGRQRNQIMLLFVFFIVSIVIACTSHRSSEPVIRGGSNELHDADFTFMI